MGFWASTFPPPAQRSLRRPGSILSSTSTPCVRLPTASSDSVRRRLWLSPAIKTSKITVPSSTTCSSACEPSCASWSRLDVRRHFPVREGPMGSPLSRPPDISRRGGVGGRTTSSSSVPLKSSPSSPSTTTCRSACSPGARGVCSAWRLPRRRREAGEEFNDLMDEQMSEEGADDGSELG